MKRTESKENYLKAILDLEQEKGMVHAVDVAEALKVSKPSVSRAITLLKEERCVTVDERHAICLTTYGRELAEEMERRYQTFYHFFRQLGVSEGQAAVDAHRVEHVVSDETVSVLRKAFTVV